MKKELRAEIRAARKNIVDKTDKDNSICDRFLNSDLYKNAEIILCYAALPDEINADIIINSAISDNKTLAVPYCVDDCGNMQFYIINALSDLSVGSFNVREPDIKNLRPLEDYNNSVIIVPAMCYDKKGYRIGYGKGYYDRFLQNRALLSVGLCYNSFIKNEIPTDIYDIAVNYIVTENEIIHCDNGGYNG